MKPFYIILTAVLGTILGTAQAQQDFLPDARPASKEDSVKYTLLKPTDKALELVKADERNPFAKVDDGTGRTNEKGESEENTIRERLEKLRVVGVSPGEHGLRVMLGDIVLQSGELVPPLLPEQSVALKVGSITERAIELLWMEERSGGLPQRKLTIPVDLRPHVRYQLKGFPTDKNKWEKEKEDTADVPVGRLFPVVSRNWAEPPVTQKEAVPRAVPVDQPPTLAPLPGEAPGTDGSTAHPPQSVVKSRFLLPDAEGVK
jgi:hypothetical protein